MLISIIIPTLNRLSYLKKTMLSVRNQTNDNYEIIVIDNASTDGTREWLESQPDILIICHNNTIPIYENWNTGFKQAKGDFLVLLSDDDILHPDCINIIQSVPDPLQYSLIIGRHDIIDENDKITINQKGFNNIENGVLQPKEGLSLFSDGVAFRLCSIFFNRTKLLQLNIDLVAKKFKITAADSELIQLMAISSPIYILDLNRSIANYRVWKNSGTSETIYSKAWHDEIDIWMDDFESFSKDILSLKKIKDAISKVKLSNLHYAIIVYRSKKNKTSGTRIYLIKRLLTILFEHFSFMNLMKSIKYLLLLI
ncbi:glycosyltransferase family 2 protein [Treponema primitia]|uniref:glycosyltransferase family 2 protein n=1 Tax=Treponema primitia TaxID=88058 RepID=UPI00025555FF|nr:glycosyltransferase [Treponema primitia]